MVTDNSILETRLPCTRSKGRRRRPLPAPPSDRLSPKVWNSFGSNRWQQTQPYASGSQADWIEY